MLICFLLALLLLASCDNLCPPPGGHGVSALLAQADSLMTVNPDSAYNLLIAADSAHRHWRRADRMRYELTLAEAMNKAYRDFTTDSVLQLVVRYYDRHGSRNDQLKARYLLGCTYRDMGEAPAAVNAWQEAVEKADTTSTDCDYNTLYRVYGQMAELYHKQLLLSEEIISLRHAASHAQTAGDTLSTLWFQTKIGSTYFLLNKADSAELTLIEAQTGFEKHNYIQQGLLASTPLIYLYLHQQGRLGDAKRLMDRYEELSHDFDEHHELHPSKRQYYRYRGLYFEHLGQLDSAEYYYRKIYRPGMDYVSKDPMYKGLLSIFTKRHQADSIAKYAQLYGEANDSSIAIRDRELTAQMAATYNYSRAQQDASVQRAKALRNTHRLIIVSTISFALLAIFLSIILWYRRWQRQKQAELQRLEGELQRTKREFDNNQIMLGNLDFIYHEALRTIKAMGLEQTRTRAEQEETVSELKRRFSESEKALQATIKNQSTHIEVLEQRLGRLATSKEQESIFSHPFIAHIIEVARKPDVELNQDEWNRLMEIWRGYYPKLSADLLANTEVTKQGMRVCLLTSLFLRGKDIANLFNVTSGRITNLKSDVNEAMFGKKDARALLPNLVAFYHIQQPYEADNTTKV